MRIYSGYVRFLLALVALAGLSVYGFEAGFRGAPVSAHTPAAATPLPTSRAPAATPSASTEVIITDPASQLLADPKVPRPNGTPCVVTLYENVLLDVTNDFTHAYDYTPPAACAGPWLKVVLEAEYAYDEYASPGDFVAAGVWLKGSNLHFGGRPPVFAEFETGRMERDISDYAALLRQPGTGHVVLDEEFSYAFLSEPYIRATARVLIYPALHGVPRMPDAVYPLIRFRTDETELLRSGMNTLAGTLTLPRNIERAYLDVLAFGANGIFGSNNGDPAWWSCTSQGVDLPYLEPVQMYQEFGGCNRGTFREARISIDGEPAGVAPLVPWVKSGLIPPLHANNLMPYRVDLTPFAGPLSDGNPHAVAVTMVKGGPDPDNVVVRAAASLLVYRDPDTAIVSGAITRNTLVGQPGEPEVVSTLQNNGDITAGKVTTTLAREFVIQGYIDTARGRIRNQVAQTTSYSTVQRFNNLRSGEFRRYHQEVQLQSKVSRVSESYLGSVRLRLDSDYSSFPLYQFMRDSRRGFDTWQTWTDLRQGLHLRGVHDRQGKPQFRSTTRARFDHSDMISYVDGQFVDSSSDTAKIWDYTDNHDSCYSADWAWISGMNTVLYDAGARCPGGRNQVRWFAHPDGSPDGLGWLEGP